MNQPTHAWLAVEAYRKIAALALTDEGKKKKLDGLENLLGAHLSDVVVAAWLPDSLIKDMTFGHIFKNTVYKGDQKDRFTLTKNDLQSHLAADTRMPRLVFDDIPDDWWAQPYRVKTSGGHLPARVNSLCQTARDMLKMGDAEVAALTGINPPGAAIISKPFLYSPRNVAMMFWMTSHYIADAHMPFHCDSRALASTAKQKTHGEVEDLWGEQIAELFHASAILKKSKAEILAAEAPAHSHFSAIDFGTGVSKLKNSGDPWKEAVYICRASFAASFALVPPDVSAVDDQVTGVSLDDILRKDFCGEDRFWKLSVAIMTDAASAIAMFWQDVWLDYCQ